MARNRKHESAAIRFGPTLKALLLCLLIGGAGVGYVWQKDQIYQLGRQIKQREVHLRDLADQNEKLRKQLSTMRSPSLLEARIKELKLGLLQPDQAQIWQLPEPSRESPAPSAGQQYAARAARGSSVP
jgi:cell division protein FtsB